MAGKLRLVSDWELEALAETIREQGERHPSRPTQLGRPRFTVPADPPRRVQRRTQSMRDSQGE